MYQTAIDMIDEFLRRQGIRGQLHGDWLDREYWLEFSTSTRVYRLYCEFPMLPTLDVWDKSGTVRIESEYILPSQDIATDYYKTIEQTSLSKLEKYRGTQQIDRWLIPVAREFIQEIEAIIEQDLQP
jgi:hypothetical protein